MTQVTLCQCPQAGLFISTLRLISSRSPGKCQCPQAGLFISTGKKMFPKKNTACVNALKRAYSFLLTKDFAMQWGSQSVNALKRAYSFLQSKEFYGSRILCVNALKRAYSFLRDERGGIQIWQKVSMPSSGLIHFYKIDMTAMDLDYLCQCPQAGLFISTSGISRKGNSLLVSMPSSGLIHFYIMKLALVAAMSMCQCPQAGLFISTKPESGILLEEGCVNALKRAYSFLRGKKMSKMKNWRCVNALKRAYSFLQYERGG